MMAMQGTSRITEHVNTKQTSNNFILKKKEKVRGVFLEIRTVIAAGGQWQLFHGLEETPNWPSVPNLPSFRIPSLRKRLWGRYCIDLWVSIGKRFSGLMMKRLPGVLPALCRPADSLGRISRSITRPGRIDPPLCPHRGPLCACSLPLSHPRF